MAKLLIDISDVISFIGSKNFLLCKQKDTKIKGFSPLSLARPGEMAFCSVAGKKGLELIKTSKASLIICSSKLKKDITDAKASLIFVDNPRLWFIRCLRNFVSSTTLRGIHPTAIVNSNRIGRDVYVGPFTFIDKHVAIGDNTIIQGGVHIFSNTSIGKNVFIDSSTVIGADGFGYEKNEDKRWEKFPHIGGICIGDEVDIGANVCIDRGVLQDTVIGAGTRIDNLVHIAHNVKIGMNCMIIAQSLLGGSCILEDGVFIGAGALIKDGGIRIGNNAFVGMGAVVVRDVQPNTTVIGVPARPMRKKKNN